MIIWQTVGQELGEAHYAHENGATLYISSQIDKRTGAIVGWVAYFNLIEIDTFRDLDMAKDVLIARSQNVA